jgi:transketolase
LHIPNPAERIAAFGFDTIEVDGHDLAAIKAALAKPTDRPKAVVGNAIKGFPCPTLVDNVFEWHRKSPNDEQFQQLMGELDA